ERAEHTGAKFLLQPAAQPFGDFKRAHPNVAQDVATENPLQFPGLLLGPRTEVNADFEWELEAGRLQTMQRLGECFTALHVGADQAKQFPERYVDRDGDELRGRVRRNLVGR